MSLVAFEVLPLPEAQGEDPANVLVRYNELLRFDIPGLVVRHCTLDELANIVVPAGLVTPSNAFDNPFGPHEEDHFSEDIGLEAIDYQPTYHIDGLPIRGLLTALHHHKTTCGAHELTAATFTSRFISQMQRPMTADVRNDTRNGISKNLEASMRHGKLNPKVVMPEVYRGTVSLDDVVVIRIVGESPTIHDFRTLPEAGTRGAIVRGYTTTTAPTAL